MKPMTTALCAAAVFLGATTGSAPAQERTDAAESAGQDADEAFLKAYFREKELKDYAAAESAYAAAAALRGASREVEARSLLGRARCLERMGRGDEAATLFARVAKEFADVADAAQEAGAAQRRTASAGDGTLDSRIRSDIDAEAWRDQGWKYGARGVPGLAALLRDDSPERVYRAAETLSRIEAPEAADALVAALAPGGSSYPEQVRRAIDSGFACRSATRRIADSGDEEAARDALARLVFTFGDAAAMSRVLGDPELRKRFLESISGSEADGRLLLSAVAAGGDARRDALTRLEGDALGAAALRSLLDPPAQVLGDEAAVRAILHQIVLVLRRLAPNQRPSPALTAAFLRSPACAPLGIRFALSTDRPCADPDALVDAIGRNGVGFPLAGAWTDESLAAQLVVALGPRPAPETLRRLAAQFPFESGGNYEQGRLPSFVRALLASGVTEGDALLAFQSGIPESRLDAQEQFLVEIRGATRTWRGQAAWAVDAFLRVLATSSESSVRRRAAEGLHEWQSALGEGAGLAAHATELVAALGRGGSDHLVAVLANLGQPAKAALRAALPGHPDPELVVEALAELKDDSVVPEIERLFETAEDEEAMLGLASSLVRLRGDAAEPGLTAAIAAQGGKFAPAVLRAADGLGADVQRRLIRTAIEKGPGAVARRFGSSSNFEPLTQDDRREIARAALRSPSPDDRLWAATQEAEVLDFAAWDALLAAAQDTDYEIRDAALKALRAIRDKENEIETYRAMGEERATRKRIEVLLASEESEQRRAGVAAIAATGLAGMVNDLIRLAAEDPDDQVRDDARRALLALAKPAPAVPSPPANEK